MATIKPISPSRGRAALLATACLVVPLIAGEAPGAGSLAEKETARRNAAVEEAQMLLQKGDEAYNAGRYSDAVDAYAGARELLPDAPATAALRSAATERYAQASVEKARGLSRKGDVSAAKTTVDKVLSENVAPNDPGALNMRAQLDDPIRTNPALTAEHAKDVDEVRRLLYTAEGAYQLGKYDEAISTYQNVLRIDSTNSAARRGMETAASAKIGYYKAAQDQTRAEMLNQVEAAWQMPISEKVEVPLGPEMGLLSDVQGMTVEAKIKQIVVPKVNLDQVSLEEAIDFLRTVKADDGSGVNLTVNLGAEDGEVARKIRGTKFSLQLNGVPMAQVLKYITDATHTMFSTDDYSVIITPVGSSSAELITRNYRVPPDFITSISTSGAAAGNAADADPFAADQPKEGLLTTRLSVREALEKQGVSFPEGASASYIAASSMLRVINTATNQDIVSQMVQAAAQTEPVSVAVRVTMIKVQQNLLTELGFDWLVNPMGLTASTMFASGGTPGNMPGRRRNDFVSPVGGTSVDGVPSDPGSLVRNLATNGLRSGDQAVQNNTLEAMLNNPDHTVVNNVAPGVMAVTGLFSEGQVQMVMRGLDQKKGVDIMAKPAVVTRSGQQANVAIVREFIYPSEYEPPELPNSVGDSSESSPVTPAMPTAFETKNIGIELEVLPVADAEKRYVDVTLNPSFTDFDGFVNYGSPINSTTTDPLGNSSIVRLTNNLILMPVFSVQRANTQLSVADGATVAIGGLMAESIQMVEDKVPVFGDLPVVGRLFSTQSRRPVSTAVIFLVNLELLDPTGRPYRNR